MSRREKRRAATEKGHLRAKKKKNADGGGDCRTAVKKQKQVA